MGNSNTVAFVLVEKNMTDTEKLETAFKLTNSIDTAWWLNENVEPLTKGTRSTSVGDMVLIGTTKYKCEPMGWSKV